MGRRNNKTKKLSTESKQQKRGSSLRKRKKCVNSRINTHNTEKVMEKREEEKERICANQLIRKIRIHAIVLIGRILLK